MRGFQFILAALSIAALFIVPACTGPSIDQVSEIPVGCLIPSSATPTAGPNLIKAVQVAVEMVNSEGGIAGKPVKLLLQDEGPTPATALYAAHKLVEEGKVQVIIGGTTSEVVLTLGPYLESKCVLLVSPSATSGSLSDYGWSRWVFRISPSDSLQGGVIARMMKDRGYKKTAMLVQDTVYGRDIANTTMQFIKGIVNVSAYVRYNPTKMSYLAELNEVKDGIPGCVLHAGHYDDAAVVYKQALEQGLDNIAWIATDGVYDMPLDRYADAARFMEKTVTGTVPVPDKKSQKFNAFRDRYFALYNMEPSIYCDTSYDGLELIAAAIKSAGVYHGPDIRDAMLKVGHGYQGASGVITFSQSGERQAGIYGIWKVVTEGAQYKFQITGQPVQFTRSITGF